jgi:Ca2+-binding RTX toxin-like protein
MATRHTISGLASVTGYAEDLPNGTSLVVTSKGQLISVDASAIRANGNANITINGDVSGSENGLLQESLGQSSTVVGLVVGKNGTISGKYAVNVGGGDLLLINKGEIFADLYGIYLPKVGSNSHIYNYGSISGFYGGLVASETVAIYNFGTIDGGLLTSISLSSGYDIVSNDGKLFGGVFTGAGSDQIINAGQIYGYLNAGLDSDTIVNRGTITGTVDGGDGSDLVDNSGGRIDGTIFLGADDDTLRPGATIESADGSTGSNTLDFSRGGAVTLALDGSLEASGWAIDDVYTNFANVTGSRRGNDVLVGDGSVNVLTGLGGNDSLSGGAGGDQLDGGNGGDTLNGNEGDDTLLGGAGKDVLTGGAGRDMLTGGVGSDVFLFASGDFAGTGTVNADVILDFSRTEKDRIDLSAIDANAALAGDQPFTFLGTGAFTKVAGQLNYTEFTADAQKYDLIEGDTNGDGVADFSIRVGYGLTYAKSDFIL